MRKESIPGNGMRCTLGAVCVIAGTLGVAAFVSAQTPFPAVAPATTKFMSREEAVRFALQNNPNLMVVRQQSGFAQAAIVSAKTYPFNPVYTGVVGQNGGPTNAMITNRVFNEHYVTLELELRGQGGYRRAAANATASRIEWEIAQQEMAVTIAVLRAYNTALYREKKLQALDEIIKLNEQVAEHIGRLFEAGKMKGLDAVMARAELDGTRAQRGQLRTALTVARSELRRQMGSNDDSFTLFGSLEVELPKTDQSALTQLAMDNRPDFHARQHAVTEAQAALNLIEANRFGNPSVGPFYEYDNTRVSVIGARVSMPLPVLNTKRAEIMKAETEVSKVRGEVQQLEVQIAQDVQAALSRLADARKWAADYEHDVMPNLQKARQEVEKLFANNDPGVDLSKLLAVTRAYLKANETLVDARYEVSQAEADLAMAVAEPSLALGRPQSPPPADAPLPAPGNNPLLQTRAILGTPRAAPETGKN